MTIAKLLTEVKGENAKAVQVGGASGQCIPASQFDRLLAFEDVSTGGSVIVFGPHRDMLDVVENFLEFFIDESCGQCTPCRKGVPKLLEGVELLKQGKCSMRLSPRACSLGETLQLASKCGLGQSSPQRLALGRGQFPGRNPRPYPRTQHEARNKEPDMIDDPPSGIRNDAGPQEPDASHRRGDRPCQGRRQADRPDRSTASRSACRWARPCSKRPPR